MAPAVVIEDRALPLTSIDAPEMDVRVDRDPEALDELSRDIGRRGVLHPILVARVADRYEVVDGFTRLLAARRAGLLEIPCRIYPEKTADLEFAKYAANIYRLEMSPCDEAVALGKLFEFVCGQDIEQLCARVNKSETYVSSRLELLNGFPDVFAALRGKQIGIGVAQELNKIPDDKFRAHYLAHAVRSGATKAVVQLWVQEFKTMFGPSPSPAAEAAAPPAGIADAPHNPFTCEICGKADNVHLIRQINVHQHCKLAILDPLLANARGEA
jgi:ParB/RepB/Spo0J family partition protein